jgi:hypothetical protein
MPIDFPDNPTNGDAFTSGGKTWTYDGTRWVSVVSTTAISDSAVTESKIAANAVTEGKINSGAVTAGKIASNAVTESKINAGAVTQEKLASGLSGITVTTTELRDSVIPSPFNGQFIFLTDTASMQRWDGSSWVMVITTVPTGAPTELALVSTTPTTATISFTSGPDGGSTIINYQYSLSTDGGTTFGSYVALSPSDGSSPITITGLAIGTSYQIKLKAVNALGTGSSESNPLSFTTSNLSIEYMVVAGGGGGGAGHGGGGGAGGYRTGTLSFASGTYTATIGAGGTGGGYNSSTQTSGANSVFGSITSTGGGRGAAQNSPGITAASSGGSGGGGSSTTSGVFSGAAGNAGGFTPPEGYAGGTPAAVSWPGAGGGGSSGVGTYTGTVGGGGPGTSNSITGTAITYAAGGHGAAPSSGVGSSGGANTGTGGGGSRETNGAGGGSGVVVVRYLTSDATGSTITGGTKVVGPTGATTYTVHTFTSSGSLVIA